MTTRTMFAARAYPGEHYFQLEDITIPHIGPTDVLVKVFAAGMSRGLLALWQYTDMIKLLPAVIGHEIAGMVVEVGSEVHHVKANTRVRVHTPLACGQCRYCLANQETLCKALGIIGYALYGQDGLPMYEQYHNGGLAQYVKVPYWTLDVLPSAVSFESAAKLGTVASAFRALKECCSPSGTTLVVTGASGATGASALLCASLFGFTKTIAVATHEEGLVQLKQLLPDITAYIATENLAEDWEEQGKLSAAIRAYAGDDGPDAVIDFMPFGREVTMQAIRSMRPGGKAILVAGNLNELNLSYLEIMRNSYEIKGLDGGRRQDVQELLRLLEAHRIDLAPLITHVYPLKEVNRAAEIVMGREGNPILVVVHPNDETTV